MTGNDKQAVGEKKIGDDSITVLKLGDFINSHKAASPTDPDVYWIHLKPKEIALIFEQEHSLKESHGLVKRQLLDMNFKYRKLSKNLTTGKYADRDKQFKVIFSLIALMSLQTPIVSIDCKKKEVLGKLYRAGKSYVTEAIKVYDRTGGPARLSVFIGREGYSAWNL